MKYEAPELTALTPAINAVQGADVMRKPTGPLTDSPLPGNEEITGYMDWGISGTLPERPKQWALRQFSS